MVRDMKRRMLSARTVVLVMLAACGAVRAVAEGPGSSGPSTAATARFDGYIAGVEARLDRQHASASGFLVGGADVEARVRRGELVVEEVSPAGGAELPGALLHHWRGTAFAPGATAKDFERVMRDFAGYPRVFAPQVMRASVTGGQGDRVQAVMRVRQKHVITVVMDVTYNVVFGNSGAGQGWSSSRSTRVAEIEGTGTAKERMLRPDEEHGFLWRMNTYWSFEERDGGLWMQVESVTLSRGIPVGLGWAVRPFVESVPRDSLEFTLRATSAAVRR